MRATRNGQLILLAFMGTASLAFAEARSAKEELHAARCQLRTFSETHFATLMSATAAAEDFRHGLEKLGALHDVLPKGRERAELATEINVVAIRAAFITRDVGEQVPFRVRLVKQADSYAYLRLGGLDE